MTKLDEYQPYLNFIDEQEQHMISLTHDWSAMNTGSHNLAGLAKFCSVLEDNFLWLGGEMSQITLPKMQQIDSSGNEVMVELGKALNIRKRPNAPIQIFLGGHMDTVFADDDAFQKPYFEDNDVESGILRGPGVADLKGGLVVMLKALEALEKSPWAENIGWEILINPDEEIGSIGSNENLKTSRKT